MTMIDTVATAALASLDRDEVYVGEGDISHSVLVDGYVDFRSIARAVIQAMREPTEAMRDRYNDPEIVGYGPDGSDHDKVWQAGIDAALAETQ